MKCFEASSGKMIWSSDVIKEHGLVNEKAKIVDAICTRGFEMMAHRYINNLIVWNMINTNFFFLSLVGSVIGQSKDVLRLHQLSRRDERSFLA